MTKELEKQLEKREEEVSRFWGLQFDRHGSWSEPTKEVSWDLISEPISALQYDIANGELTSSSLPDTIFGKRWVGQSGSATNPAFTFEYGNKTGLFLTGSSLGISISGTEQAVFGTDLILTNRLAWKDGTSYKGEFIHANSADRTYTFQDLTGTIYQTSGTDVAIADGGTGQSTQTAAFDALAPATTKGDVIVYNGSDNIRVAVGSNDQSLVADSSEASGVKWAGPLTKTVYKAADEDVDNGSGTGTTLQNDNHLLFAIAANDTWTGTFVLFVADLNSGGSADFKIKITIPAGATIRYGSSGGEGVGTLGEDSQDYVDNTSDTIVFSHSTTDEYVHEIRFSVKNSTNAGNVQLQWAQNAAQSSAVRVVQGSFLQATKVI
jgi:hypothetical protein